MTHPIRRDKQETTCLRIPWIKSLPTYRLLRGTVPPCPSSVGSGEWWWSGWRGSLSSSSSGSTWNRQSFHNSQFVTEIADHTLFTLGSKLISMRCVNRVFGASFAQPHKVRFAPCLVISLINGYPWAYSEQPFSFLILLRNSHYVVRKSLSVKVTPKFRSTPRKNC